MSLFGLGKKKEEVKIEPACACNGEVATYEASSCCCGGQQVENCCGGDNKLTSIKVLGAGCKSCHDQYENVKKAIEELGLGIEVEYITDMEKVMAYGVTYTRLITSRVKLKFKFYYATLASELHPNVIQQAEELKDTIKGLFPNAVVEVIFVDSDALFDMYNAVIENRVNLKFADIPISPNQKNYIALVDLKSYFNFIVNDEGDVRKSFFDSNVRDYQGN